MLAPPAFIPRPLTHSFAVADALHLPLADKSVDLVFGSPPYCDARTYGIDAQRDCRQWIDWMLAATAEACRVSRGLVLWVVAGVTRDWCYWPGPEGLLYEWWKQGGQCWRPCYWHRVGIPGSGGKQWMRADVEYVLAFKGEKGKLSYANNTAMGHPPKWAPGGEMSYRQSSGTRRNAWSQSPNQVLGNRNKDGTRDGRARAGRTEAVALGGVNQWGHSFNSSGTDGNEKGGIAGHCGDNRSKNGDYKHELMRVTSGTGPTGEQLPNRAYPQPVLANPGNWLSGDSYTQYLDDAGPEDNGTIAMDIVVGGGKMGDPLAHKNEAPFPEKIAEFFIKSLVPSGGIVCDPFAGSGTTVCVARKFGRSGLGFDLRQSQVDLGNERLGKI